MVTSRHRNGEELEALSGACEVRRLVQRLHRFRGHLDWTYKGPIRLDIGVFLGIMLWALLRVLVKLEPLFPFKFGFNDMSVIENKSRAHMGIVLKWPNTGPEYYASHDSTLP